MLLVVMQLQGTALEQTAMLPKSGELIFLTPHPQIYNMTLNAGENGEHARGFTLQLVFLLWTKILQKH